MPKLPHREVQLPYRHALPGTCRRCGKPGADKRGLMWHEWCWERHREESNYRGAAERREGKIQRCVICHRVDGEYVTHNGKLVRLKVQRDHVIALALNGPHDWTAPRCQLCHQDKTTQDNRRVQEWRERDPRSATRASRRDRRASMPSNRPRASTRPPSRTRQGRRENERPSPIANAIRYVSAIAIIGASAITFFEKWPDVLATASAIVENVVPYAIAAVALAVAIAGLWLWYGWRKRARAEAVYRLTNAIAREARVDPTVINVRARRWSHGVPVRGECWYSETVNDAPDSEVRIKVEEILQRKLGLRLRFDWQDWRDTVSWWPAPPEPDRPAADGPAEPPSVDAAADEPADTAAAEHAAKLQAIQQRVEDKIRAKIKDGEISVTWGDADEQGPKAFRLEYPSSYPDESDERRLDLVEAVNKKAPGRWAAEWDTEQNTVTFTRRPKMPAMVSPPRTPLGNSYELRYAIDESGQPASWNLKVSSHGMIIGATNSGKTSTLRALIVSALLEGFVVVIVDPKQTELIGFEGWPGVRIVATETAHMAVVTFLMHEEMDRRYGAVKLGKAREEEYKPVLFVVDEKHEFIERLQEFYLARGAKSSGGDPPPVRQQKAMGRLSRKARMHLLDGIQRPDAAIVGGPARDNYRFRVANGPLSKTAAQMFFEAVDVGRDIPEDAKGRATGRTSTGKLGEVQINYIPDPHEWDHLTDDERALLTQLKAAAAKVESDALEWLTPEYVEAVAEDMFPELDDDAPTPRRRRRRTAGAAKKTAPAAVEAAPPPRRQVPSVTDGWMPTSLNELQEHDRVRIVLDGEPTEVEIVELVESTESDELVEVSYKHPDGDERVVAVPFNESVWLFMD